MRNKAKFRKPKNELNPLYDKGLQDKIGAFVYAKTKPNKPKRTQFFISRKGSKAKSNPIYGEQCRTTCGELVESNFTRRSVSEDGSRVEVSNQQSQFTKAVGLADWGKNTCGIYRNQ
jgi:hypothetical protein